MIGITLVCSTCDEIISVEVSRLPQFSFELYEIAKKVEWFPVVDIGGMRTAIFCCEECYKKQLTKNGRLRKRFLRIPKEETT